MNFGRKDDAPSLLGKINIAFSTFVVICVAVLVSLFFYYQSRSITEDRKIFLEAFGSTIVSTVEKPFSRRHYSAVQSLLSVEKLPGFIISLRVLDASGVERAADGRGEGGESCRLIKSSSFPVPGGGTVVIVSSNCDIKDRIERMLAIMVVFALLTIVSGMALGRVVILWAWSPARAVIETASNSKTFGEDIVNAADKELRPLISLAFRSYKRMADSELYDEMLHNLASPVNMLRQILKRTEGRGFRRATCGQPAAASPRSKAT